MSKFLTPAGKGQAFTLPNNQAGVLSGIDDLSAAIQAVNKSIGPLAAATVQVLLSHSFDQSAVDKLCRVLYRNGEAGKSPMFIMYAKFMRKCGVTIQQVQDDEGENEKGVDHDHVTFKIDHSELKKRKNDPAKLEKVYEAMWDVSEGEGLFALYQNRKVKKIEPKGKSKKSKDEEAGAVADVSPFLAIMQASGCEAVFSDLCTNEPDKAKYIADAVEYVMSKAIKLKSCGTLKNELQQDKNLDKILGLTDASKLIPDA